MTKASLRHLVPVAIGNKIHRAGSLWPESCFAPLASFLRGRAEWFAATPFMKKPTRCIHPSETSSRSPRDYRRNGAKEGNWSFNLASDILFALGSTESARRVAYRTSTGELRFLPR